MDLFFRIPRFVEINLENVRDNLRFKNDNVFQIFNLKLLFVVKAHVQALG